MCVCVCLFPPNLKGYFVSLLIESMAGKNVSPSDEKLQQFLKNVFVADKMVM